ncbi:hypothetical protein HFN76_14100 [Rhizobium laguerreae]|nr:hypothetical protein [Rhizobium laguerreae]MBY3513357.1 hypothetical protein [Rhizobium laguerreae]
MQLRAGKDCLAPPLATAQMVQGKIARGAGQVSGAVHKIAAFSSSNELDE